MDDKIVCLVGASGSGKSSIAELLEKEGYNYIQSYTDRPKRTELEKGHIFITKTEYSQATIQNEFNHNWIAFTFYNGHHYFATKEQYQGKGISIYVIDPSGVKYLKKYITDADTTIIYLKCDEKIRYNRIISRNNKKVSSKPISVNESRRIQTSIKNKALERIEVDKIAFKDVPYDYIIDANRSVKEVFNDIKNIIMYNCQVD